MSNKAHRTPAPTPRRAGTGESAPKTEARHLRRLAWLLDESIRLPGGYRIGIDGIIGLIPGIGDGIGLLASGYIVTQAARLGVPTSILTRMTLNVLLESLIGAIPIIGDMFDFAWKANLRNLEMMNHYLENPVSVRKSARRSLILISVVALVVISTLGYLLYHLIAWLWSSLAISQGVL